MTEYPEFTQDVVMCVCAQESSLPCIVTDREEQRKRRTAQLEYKQHTEAEERKQSQWSILYTQSPHFYWWPHIHKKIIFYCMNPSKPTHKGWQVTCEKQNDTHQALSEFHRTIEGRQTEKPRLSQNKRGGKKKRKAGMDEGRGAFKAPFFLLLPMQTAARPSSFYLWFSSSFSLWLLLFFLLLLL